MNKNQIEKIAWFIPIKSLRDKFKKIMNDKNISDDIIEYNNKVKYLIKK